MDWGDAGQPAISLTTFSAFFCTRVCLSRRSFSSSFLDRRLLKPLASERPNSPIAKNVSLSMPAASLPLKSSEATSLRLRRLGSLWGSASRFSCSASDVIASCFQERSLQRSLREGKQSRPADKAVARRHAVPLSAPLPVRAPLPAAPRGGHTGGDGPDPAEPGKKRDSGRRWHGPPSRSPSRSRSRSRFRTPTWLRAAPRRAPRGLRAPLTRKQRPQRNGKFPPLLLRAVRREPPLRRRRLQAGLREGGGPLSAVVAGFGRPGGCLGAQRSCGGSVPVSGGGQPVGVGEATGGSEQLRCEGRRRRREKPQ